VKALADFLRKHRHRIVREQSVLEPRWDMTFGEQPPTTATIEVIDFDRLCEAIDEFGGDLIAGRRNG
jgi:hypothetical protein